MGELREGQIRTLRTARRLQDGFTGAFEAADFAHIVGIRYQSTDSARSKLDRLAAKGYLEADRSTPPRVFYTLTDKGRAALGDSQKEER